MKSILISIQPKWCELIASGKKTIEVRKTRPKIETPFKCYVYMTQGKLKDLGSYSEWIYRNRQKVICEFVCDEIIVDEIGENSDIFCKDGCLTLEKLKAYSPRGILYGWHISDLVIYDVPKELSEFRKPCNKDYDCFLCYKSGYAPDMHISCFNILTRPPQSWCYVEGLR